MSQFRLPGQEMRLDMQAYRRVIAAIANNHKKSNSLLNFKGFVSNFRHLACSDVH